MNLKKLQKAHAEYGKRMAGRKYQDIKGAGVSTSCQPSCPDAPGAHNVIINPKFSRQKSVVRARTREGDLND